MEAKYKQAKNNRYYIRSICTSVFITTIGIDCSYKLDSLEAITPRSYDIF